MAAHGGAEADFNGVSEALWGDVVFVNTTCIHPNRAQPKFPIPSERSERLGSERCSGTF